MPAGSREILERAFSRAISAGTLGHAYLLRGEDCAVTRAFALELAASLDCRNGSSWACRTCPECRTILAEGNPDVHVVEPEEGKVHLAIDQVRELIDRMMTRSWHGRGRRAILDPADRLTEDASNCLLSLLEEPPPDTLFLLVTAQPEAILPTLRSRAMEVFVAPREGLAPNAADDGNARSAAALLSESLLVGPAPGPVGAVRAFLERIREGGEASPALRKILDPVLASVLDGLRSSLRLSAGAPAKEDGNAVPAAALASWGPARIRALAERTLELRGRLHAASLPLALEAYAVDVAAIRSGSLPRHGIRVAPAG